MQGRLFTLLEQGFPSYFVLLLVGFIFATVSGAITAKRIGQDPDVFVDLGLAMLIAGVAGARILHVFADGYFMDYVHLCTDPSKVNLQLSKLECADADYNGVWNAAQGICVAREADCFAWAKFWNGGLTYYGGFIGATAAAWYLLHHDRFPFWKGADMVSGSAAWGVCLPAAASEKRRIPGWASSFRRIARRANGRANMGSSRRNFFAPSRCTRRRSTSPPPRSR
jgi:phosphatidylglycerol:prolipoprotein diacylglycerol transferase